MFGICHTAIEGAISLLLIRPGIGSGFKTRVMASTVSYRLNLPLHLQHRIVDVSFASLIGV